jgi:arylsulfatase A-like enzyme
MAALLFIFLGFTACTNGPKNESLVLRRVPRDVILVTIDTMRADATGFSGAGKVQTPTIDRLADGGVVFLSAHAHAVVTLPSHCSILTGLYPYQHGVRDNAGFVLRSDIPTLGSILRGAGYGASG